MKQIYTTTLRLNLEDEDDRQAYEHLQRMGKKQYRSYSKAIVAAVNEHFERQARLASDPYLDSCFFRCLSIIQIIQRNLACLRSLSGNP